MEVLERRWRHADVRSSQELSSEKNELVPA